MILLVITRVPSKSVVNYDGHTARLNPIETQILVALDAAYPLAASISTICLDIWNEDSKFTRYSIRVYKSNINKKLPGLIVGAFSYGYYSLDRGQGDVFTDEVGGLKVNNQCGYCTLFGMRFKLNPVEMRALMVLVKAYPAYSSTAHIASEMWPNEWDVQRSGVAGYICVLRRKMGAEAVRHEAGKGYRLEVEL